MSITRKARSRRGHRAIAILALLGIAIAMLGLVRAAAASERDARGSASYVAQVVASSSTPARVNDKALFCADAAATSILSRGTSRRNGAEVFHHLSIRIPQLSSAIRVGEPIGVANGAAAIDYFERTRDGIVFRATSATGIITISARNAVNPAPRLSGSFHFRLDDESRPGEQREITAGVFTTDAPPPLESATSAPTSAKANESTSDNFVPAAGCGGEATIVHEPDDDSGGSDPAPASHDAAGGCQGDSEPSDEDAACAVSAIQPRRARYPRTLATRAVGTFGPPAVIALTLLALRRRRSTNS